MPRRGFAGSGSLLGLILILGVCVSIPRKIGRPGSPVTSLTAPITQPLVQRTRDPSEEYRRTGWRSVPVSLRPRGLGWRQRSRDLQT